MVLTTGRVLTTGTMPRLLMTTTGPVLAVAATTKDEEANVAAALTPATELTLKLPLTARTGPAVAAVL